MAEIDTHVTANAGSGATAGAKLRAAREAAGLSVDAVAQQLKLAPKQVTALEEDDWQRLPGRTFARGFARNYARFVRLDPDAVLALLPAPDAAPALQRPALAASPRAIGEIPAERVAKPSAARWLVPLLLVAIVAAIGYYELSRTTLHLPALLSSMIGEGTSALSPATTTPPPSGTPGAAATKTTALPNPVADASTAAAPSTDTPKNPTAATADAASGITVLPTPAAAGTTPANDAVANAPAPPANAAATPANAAATPANVPASMPANATATEVPLVLTFKGTSWAEVKDAKGRVVLQMTGGAGMTQTVSAQPPLELALGNAREVVVTFRGHALDLSAYTRGNVARVSLQ